VVDASPVVESEKPNDQRHPAQLLPHVGAVVAVVVACTYVVGAITKVGQVTGAGFSADLVLGPTPIQQLLSLGVGTLATPEGVFALIVGTASIGVTALILTWPIGGKVKSADELEGSEEYSATATEVRSGGVRWPLKVVGGVVGASLLWHCVILGSSFASIPPLLVGPLAAGVRKATGYSPRWSVAVAGVCAAACTGLIFAFGYPTPLPEISVITHSGTVVGELLGQTDETLTIGLGNCEIESIPATEVERSVIYPRDARQIPDISSVLRGQSRQPKPPIRITGNCGT
jgi:hypothetical protein